MSEATIGNKSKYHKYAIRVMEQTGAESIVLIVFGGSNGNGMAHSAKIGSRFGNPAGLVAMLRAMADDIEKGISQPSGATVTWVVPDPKAEP